jgi:TolA-binding protein
MPATPITSRDPALEASVFWIRFKKEIAAVLIVAFLAFVGYAGYSFYSERRNAAAAGLLASAKNGADYQQVIAQYPNTPAEASAYLLLAEAQRKEKKFVDSNATLQLFINKNAEHELISTAHVTVAANLASMGRTDEAVAKYRQIAASYPKSYVAPFALLEQVELLKSKGQTDEARRACEAILTNYRDSILAGEASRQLRSLRPVGAVDPAARSAISPLNAPPPMLARPPAAAPPGKVPPSAPTPGTVKPKG